MVKIRCSRSFQKKYPKINPEQMKKHQLEVIVFFLFLMTYTSSLNDNIHLSLNIKY